MTDFVGAPPFIRITLANIVLVCLLARKKNLHHFQIWYPCFSTRWVEKESEIGLFLDLALCLILFIVSQIRLIFNFNVLGLPD